MTYSITENRQYGSREVYFDGAPSDAVRSALKGLKMRWNHKKACWYGFAAEQSIIDAILGANADDTPAEEAASVATDGYMGGGAVYGGKSGRYLYGAQLSAAIRADLKTAGIKGVSVSCKTYSGGQNITATVKALPSDFLPLGEYIKRYEINSSCAWIDAGPGESPVHASTYWAANSEEREAIRRKAAEHAWRKGTGSIMNSFIKHAHADENCIYTPAMMEKLRRIDSIIAAYRYDESNSQVDYFDTNFYYDIYTKPISA